MSWSFGSKSRSAEQSSVFKEILPKSQTGTERRRRKGIYLDVQSSEFPGSAGPAKDRGRKSPNPLREPSPRGSDQQSVAAVAAEAAAAGQAERQEQAARFESGMRGAGTCSVCSPIGQEFFSYLTPRGKVLIMVTAGVQRGSVGARGQHARM